MKRLIAEEDERKRLRKAEEEASRVEQERAKRELEERQRRELEERRKALAKKRAELEEKNRQLEVRPKITVARGVALKAIAHRRNLHEMKSSSYALASEIPTQVLQKGCIYNDTNEVIAVVPRVKRQHNQPCSSRSCPFDLGHCLPCAACWFFDNLISSAECAVRRQHLRLCKTHVLCCCVHCADVIKQRTRAPTLSLLLAAPNLRHADLIGHDTHERTPGATTVAAVVVHPAGRKVETGGRETGSGPSS